MIPEGRCGKQEGMTIQNSVKIRILQGWKPGAPGKPKNSAPTPLLGRSFVPGDTGPVSQHGVLL